MPIRSLWRQAAIAVALLAHSTASASPTELERSLAEEASLEAIVRLALARNPELAELDARAHAARALAPAAARLPEPEIEYQLWAQPLARPLALDDAEMHMLGLRQSIPAPGSLGAKRDAARAEAEMSAAGHRARERDLTLRVHRAYAEYHRAEREYRLHLQHTALAEQSLQAARAAYAGGRGDQQDVLRLAVALSRLHLEIAEIDRDRRASRGLLNSLMARAADAPLGPPAALDPGALLARAERLERALSGAGAEIEGRPEVAAERSAVARRQGELEAASAAARWPSFAIGAQYMFMPLAPDRHNYGVTLSMSLPWLSPAYSEEVRAAEANLAAERSALASVELSARYELYEASSNLRAARESLAIIERDLLPGAEQSYESAEAVYRGGSADALGMLEALQSLLDVRIERERAIARLQVALAEVERALGTNDANPPNPGRNAR